MVKKRKPMSEEARLAASQRMKARWEAKQTEAKPTGPVLDVTRDNLISESDLIERIRRMFDDGNMPSLIMVNSKQLLEILDVSNRWNGYETYASPLGDITVRVVPARDLS